MFRVTTAAAEQIRKASVQSDAVDMPLRVAAKQMPDAGVDYGMAFDNEKEGDIAFVSEGVKLVMDPAHEDMLNFVVLDYIELEEGGWNFVFIDPENPRHQPPRKKK